MYQIDKEHLIRAADLMTELIRALDQHAEELIKNQGNLINLLIVCMSSSDIFIRQYILAVLGDI